jgi:signal transduction histidine kinase
MALTYAIDCPSRLTNLARAFIAEEATAADRHELRSKLAAIGNAAYFIRRKLEQAPAFLVSDTRLGQFFQLIDDELQAVGERLQSRLRTPEEAGSEPLDLKRLAGSVLDMVRLPEALDVQRPAASGAVRANPDELALALFCLLENAVEAAMASPRPAVVLGVDLRADAWFNLWVENSGPGIDDALAEQLWRPFFTTRPGHLGVGLKIARRVARRWGGEVDVDRNARYARFGLCFPAAPSRRVAEVVRTGII